ncbi:MAG TPA: polyprenyl synthetase family protein, partial [Longimicrobiaceae bacterium]|nr:polyprenyl synthetase family protein [Longimicrobiaceae bacterium]
VRRASWRRAAEGKAGALFQLPVEGAALLAGRTPAQAAALGAPFRALGVLFQLQDDVLDLYGDKGRGMPGADLREGKVSALVVEHLALHPEHTEWLFTLLALPRAETPGHEVHWAIERFREDGALAGVLARIAAEHAAVLECPALADEPALCAVAGEMACVALAPIRHVCPGVAEVVG